MGRPSFRKQLSEAASAAGQRKLSLSVCVESSELCKKRSRAFGTMSALHHEVARLEYNMEKPKFRLGAMQFDVEKVAQRPDEDVDSQFPSLC